MKKRSIIISMFLVFALVATLPAWADSEVRIVRLSLVDGPVQLDRDTGQGFERAIMNMPIASGMALWTREDSRAEVEFEDGNTIRLTPGTRLDFTQLRLRDDGTRSTVVTIRSGRAYVVYNRKSGEDFRIVAGNREIALEKSVHFRIDVDSDRAEIAVLGGELRDSDLRVKKHNTAILDFADNGFQLEDGIDAALEDRWDSYRNEYHDSYAKSRYNGARFYGLSDLNFYGSWFNSSYGSCWRPNGFDASWSPYSSGAWAWYPGYGYTWVSLYPWGWQPYRSGAWNYAGGTGWCWSPNGNYYGFHNTPVFYAPPGYVLPQPPPRPLPPTYVGGGSGHPWRGPHPIIPVGDVDTTNWRLKHDPNFAGWDRKHHRGEPEGAPTVGGSVRGDGSVALRNPSSSASSPTAPSSSYRSYEGPRNKLDPRIGDRTYRDMPRDQRPGQRDPMQMQREQHQTQIQREQRQTQMHEQRHEQSQQRSFDRPAQQQHMSAPAPQPHMSAPAPAPHMDAPKSAPPSRGETKSNPK